MNTKLKMLLLIIVVVATAAHAQHSLQNIQGVGFSQVTITDNFWKPKMDKVAAATLPACVYQTEIKTPRIRNFEKVARKRAALALSCMTVWSDHKRLIGDGEERIRGG